MKDLTPTIIYAVWPGVKKDDLIQEVNQLGRIDYPRIPMHNGQFARKMVLTKHQGWTVMETLIEKGRMDILESTTFFSSKGRKMTLEQVLNSLEGVEVRK